MKTKDLKIGGHYEAKVSGKVQVIRITSMQEAFSPDGSRSLGMRFVAVNVATGRAVFVKSPQRLRREVGPDPSVEQRAYAKLQAAQETYDASPSAETHAACMQAADTYLAEISAG